MNPNSEDNLKKRNVSSPSAPEHAIDGFDDSKTQTLKFYKKKVFGEEEIVQWNEERTMELNKKARWFAILFSLLVSVVLISFIVEDISHLKDSPKFKGRQAVQFIFIGAFLLLSLIQIVYGCLYTMWPVNMVVERFLLMYSAAIIGAVVYSMVYQLFLSPSTGTV
jgi:hypothetical protein